MYFSSKCDAVPVQGSCLAESRAQTSNRINSQQPQAAFQNAVLGFGNCIDIADMLHRFFKHHNPSSHHTTSIYIDYIGVHLESTWHLRSNNASAMVTVEVRALLPQPSQKKSVAPGRQFEMKTHFVP